MKKVKPADIKNGTFPIKVNISIYIAKRLPIQNICTLLTFDKSVRLKNIDKFLKYPITNYNLNVILYLKI